MEIPKHNADGDNLTPEQVKMIGSFNKSVARLNKLREPYKAEEDTAWMNQCCDSPWRCVRKAALEFSLARQRWLVAHESSDPTVDDEGLFEKQAYWQSRLEMAALLCGPTLPATDKLLSASAEK